MAEQNPPRIKQSTFEPFQQFVREYKAAHPGANYKEAKAAWRQLHPKATVTVEKGPAPSSAYTPPRTDPIPPPRQGTGSELPPAEKAKELKIAPSTIWAMIWDTVYRGRAYFQYRHEMWFLSDDEANDLGAATATAWRAYVPAGSVADQALQQLWPGLMLAAAVIMTEKSKQDQWLHLQQVMAQGPAEPPQYRREPARPLDPIQPAPAPQQPVTAEAERNVWEEYARANGTGAVTNGHTPERDGATVSLLEEMRRAGAVVEAPPPPGMGLRQAFTRKDLG